MGATFGGSSQSLFGTEGPLPLLNKITTAVAVIFMLTSVTLAYISSSNSTGSVMTDLSKEQATMVDTAPEKKDIVIPIPTAESQETEGAVPAEPSK